VDVTDTHGTDTITLTVGHMSHPSRLEADWSCVMNHAAGPARHGLLWLGDRLGIAARPPGD
jgi:hypothetical protein